MIRPAIALAAAFFISACAASVTPEPARAAFETQATSAWLYDVETDTVLFEKQSDIPKPPASMSKLMTLYMLFEALRDGRVTLDEKVPVSARAAAMKGSTMFLDERDTPSVESLIKGIIVQSGNDACVAIAEKLAGSEDAFARNMNVRAADIGLTDSTFTNASGWPDPNHRMSARDLGRLATLLITEFPEYYGYFALEEYDFDGRSPANRFNRNPVLGGTLGADGLKTGHTEEAGYGLVGSAVQGNRRVIFVFSGLESQAERRSEAAAFINWGFGQFVEKNIATAGDVIGEIPVWAGNEVALKLTVAEDLTLLMPVVGRDKVETRVEYQSPFNAYRDSVAKGEQIAELIVTAPDMPEKRVPLVSDRDVTRGGFLPRMRASAFVLFDKAMGQVQSLME